MKKRYGMLLALLVMSALVSGCKFEKEIDIGGVNISLTPSATPGTQEQVTPTLEPTGQVTPTPTDRVIVEALVTENPVPIVVDYGNKAINGEALLSYFFGKSREELLNEGALYEDYGIDLGINALMGFECSTDNMLMYYNASYTDNNGYFHRSRFEFWDDKDMAGSTYLAMLGAHFYKNECSNRLMQMYPEIELESCSREEALAACTPVAEACGYEDAQVSVYAMTFEALQEQAAFTKGYVRSAPGPDYENNFYEWEKEHEAYLLVYKYTVNGRVLDSAKFDLMCIYVPKYEKIVYARGTHQLVATETSEETELISQEDAIAEVLLMLNLDSTEDITITGISMVYSPEGPKILNELEKKTMEPCWRIDYVLSDKVKATPGYMYDDWTRMISAIDGRQVKYSVN